MACAQFFSRREWIRPSPGFSACGLISFSYLVRTYDSPCFFARSTAAQTHALRWEHRRQTQATTAAVRERATTSWLQSYTTCCVAHSYFYRTLGSVIEDRAGIYELLLSAVCDRCNRHGAVLLLLCFAAAIDSVSSSEAAVPLSQAAERATGRTLPVLLSSFAYDMCHAYCCCCLHCVVELNDTLSFPTNVSIPKVSTLHTKKNVSGTIIMAILSYICLQR